MYRLFSNIPVYQIFNILKPNNLNFLTKNGNIKKGHFEGEFTKNNGYK